MNAVLTRDLRVTLKYLYSTLHRRALTLARASRHYGSAGDDNNNNFH